MSMSIYGGKKNGNSTDLVYPSNVTISTIYSDDPDDVDGVPNPDYNPVLDIDMGNRNAVIILSALNIEIEDGYFSMTAKEFQARCVAWLRANIGSRSEGFEGTVDASPGRRTVYEGGLADGYVNKQMQRLSAFASAVIEMGADIIYGA